MPRKSRESRRRLKALAISLLWWSLGKRLRRHLAKRLGRRSAKILRAFGQKIEVAKDE